MFLHTKKIEARTKAALGWPVYYYLTTYWNRCTSDHSQLPVRGFFVTL
jgi:hypothetical protein